MSDIIFDEDRSFLKPLTSESVIPQKGFEGWFYRKFPGGYTFKKTILIAVVILLFTASIFIFSLGRFNTEEEKIRNFDDRVKEARI